VAFQTPGQRVPILTPRLGRRLRGSCGPAASRSSTCNSPRPWRAWARSAGLFGTWEPSDIRLRPPEVLCRYRTSRVVVGRTPCMKLSATACLLCLGLSLAALAQTAPPAGGAATAAPGAAPPPAAPAAPPAAAPAPAPGTATPPADSPPPAGGPPSGPNTPGAVPPPPPATPPSTVPPSESTPQDQAPPPAQPPPATPQSPQES
jgi:hypothetical protein